MNERMRFDPAAATRAGNLDAAGLLVAIASMGADDNPASLLNGALGEIIGLAVENRIEECQARLAAFCEVIGPELERAAALEAKCTLLAASLNQADTQSTATADEQHALDVAIAICGHVSAGRIIAVHHEDENAIEMLGALQRAVRTLEPKFTDTEGGEV